MARHSSERNILVPTVDYDKCVACEKCVDHCAFGTYELKIVKGKRKPIVSNPNNCVVLCSGCDSICQVGAIKHPSKKEAQKIISTLRKIYPL